MYLELIEKDNYKPLPGGIFNKGFVKSYAKYVGIDEHEALQDYSRQLALQEENVEDPSPRYRPEVLTDDARSASSLITTIVFAGIILALMTGGILFVVSYIKNQADTPTAVTNTSNSTSNIATNIALPEANSASSSDEIRVEFKALSEKVSVTSTVDGTLGYDEVMPDAPKTYVAQQGLKLRYYRGFVDKVQISVNGKEMAPPPAPARGNIEFEINRENVGRIVESGQIVPAETPQPATTTASAPQTTPAATNSSPTTQSHTPAPRPTATPQPAFTPVPTPRRSPTPIVVGRPPVTRPSPN